MTDESMQVAAQEVQSTPSAVVVKAGESPPPVTDMVVAEEVIPEIVVYGREAELRPFQAPDFEEMKLPIRERMKRDLEEAEGLIVSHFKDGYFTIPSTGLRVGIIPLAEAAWQRYFLSTRQSDPPKPPDKLVKDRKGRDIATSNYDDENFQRLLGVFETHQGNVRQSQVGEMLDYIYDRGTVISIPTSWVDEYEDSLPIAGIDLSDRELKNIFLTEHMKTGGETKAIQILICGRDPLGFGEEDADKEKEDNNK